MLFLRNRDIIDKVEIKSYHTDIGMIALIYWKGMNSNGVERDVEKII